MLETLVLQGVSFYNCANSPSDWAGGEALEIMDRLRPEENAGE